MRAREQYELGSQNIKEWVDTLRKTDTRTLNDVDYTEKKVAIGYEDWVKLVLLEELDRGHVVWDQDEDRGWIRNESCCCGGREN